MPTHSQATEKVTVIPKPQSSLLTAAPEFLWKNAWAGHFFCPFCSGACLNVLLVDILIIIDFDYDLEFDLMLLKLPVQK